MARTSVARRFKSRAGVHDYIEVGYQRQHLHSPLGYESPAEVDQDAA